MDRELKTHDWQMLLHAAAGTHHGRHLQSVTSYQKSKSVNWWVFNWRTILPNSSQSDLKRRSLGLFLITVTPTPTKRTTRWVAIQDQLLIHIGYNKHQDLMANCCHTISKRQIKLHCCTLVTLCFKLHVFRLRPFTFTHLSTCMTSYIGTHLYAQSVLLIRIYWLFLLPELS